MCSPAHTCLFAALVLGVVVTTGSHLLYAFFLARYAPTCHLELDVHGPGGWTWSGWSCPPAVPVPVPALRGGGGGGGARNATPVMIAAGRSTRDNPSVLILPAY